MPYFSVIIPLYNKEKYISQTLRSVLAQTFTDFEVIIVNDGSTDGSGSAVLAFDDPRIRYFSRENSGVSAARNFGIEMAAADHIAFLDADDFWFPHFLETMKKNIDDFPEYSVFSGAIEIETAKNIIPAKYSVDRRAGIQVVNYFSASYKETVICTSCAVFHNSVFGISGVFDERLKSGQDTDLWIRIGMHFPVVFTWKILARYVYDAHSLSKNTEFIKTKIDFSRYSEAEKRDGKIKKFLDLNRYSLAIKSKVNGDYIGFSKLKNEIDFRSISLKKRILLMMPVFILRWLIRIQKQSAEWGIGSSVFK